MLPGSQKLLVSSLPYVRFLTLPMRMRSVSLLLLLLVSLRVAQAQGTVPTFKHTVGQTTYTLVGRDPGQGGTTTIPTVLVPIALSFESKKVDGKPFVLNAATDTRSILASPIFSRFAFARGNTTQYADAMLRTTFPTANRWHTLLDKPEVKPITITVPSADGYILTSRKKGRSFAVVDLEFVQRELFKQIPKEDGKLVVAVTENTTYYVDGDATECCSWGTHGVDSATGNSFVLGSYLKAAPAVVTESDVQPLTQQLAEFINDPLHDQLFHGGRDTQAPGNRVPSWTHFAHAKAGDQRCGGTYIASAYFLLEPTDTNPRNNIPASTAFLAHSRGVLYHLQNVALLPWYTSRSDGLGSSYSFPDARTLASPAEPCPAGSTATAPTVAAIPSAKSANGHALIGYWVGYSRTGESFPLRRVSPEWDYILVAFATPDKNAAEGTMQFHPPVGIEPVQLKADIAYQKSQGKKVMISLGGGGVHFTLDDPNGVPRFVSSVAQIVSDYGFDGVDIDFENPSLALDPGDSDFKHPTTPSLVHLVTALRQLHDRFGPDFLISLVPEGTQVPSGYPSYGGQFGSYLALSYAIRDILTFLDAQDYNTPPLEGLDGEIYQPGTVDYHAAMTELLLHGFPVGGDPKQFYPAMPAAKVAVGFLTDATDPSIVDQAMEYIITGKAPAGTRYKLRNPKGYPDMIGAMFWTIDDDRRGDYDYSNSVGPQLHHYPATK
jgi:chitinase